MPRALLSTPLNTRHGYDYWDPDVGFGHWIRNQSYHVLVCVISGKWLPLFVGDAVVPAQIPIRTEALRPPLLGMLAVDGFKLGFSLGLAFC